MSHIFTLVTQTPYVLGLLTSEGVDLLKLRTSEPLYLMISHFGIFQPAYK